MGGPSPTAPHRLLGTGSLEVADLSGPFDVTQAGLGDQPLAGADQLVLGGLVATPGPVGPGAAPPADRHPSVGLGSMVLVELASHRRCFG